MCDPGEREIECGVCNGEGEIVHITGINYVDGSLIERGYRCTACNGSGTVWVPVEPITMEDLECSP